MLAVGVGSLGLLLICCVIVKKGFNFFEFRSYFLENELLREFSLSG